MLHTPQDPRNLVALTIISQQRHPIIADFHHPTLTTPAWLKTLRLGFGLASENQGLPS